MRILVVSNMYPSDCDKVYGVFVKGFVDGLKSMNKCDEIELSVIRGRRLSITTKILAYIKFYLELTFRLLFRNYDVIYVHTITFTILPIRFALMFRKLPLAFNVHGDDVIASTKLKRWLRDVAAVILPKSRLVVAPSVGFKEYTMSVIPNLREDQMFVSPSAGVEDRFFIRNNNRRVDDSNIVLGYVSRIDHVKGWDLFLQAIKCLRNEGLDCCGVITGRGEDTDKMKSMIQELGLCESVKYLGRVDHENLPEIYGTFDLFIFPTRFESLGLVGLEAMAAGVPVIASDITGPNEYVKSGVNGYLFAPESVEELVEKIKKYMSLDSDDKKRMSESAVSTALSYRSQITNENLYDCILKRF